MAQVRAMAVVSWPASSNVITSSRVCSSVRAGLDANTSSTGHGPSATAHRPRMRSSTTFSRWALADRTRTATGSGERSSVRPPGAMASRKPASRLDNARVISGVGARMSEPNSARPTPSSVMADVSAMRSTSRPSDHRSARRPAAQAKCGAYSAIRWGWKAGCRVRRWRRCASPSLVSRPSPSRSRARTSPRPFPVRRACVVSSSQTSAASSTSSTRSGPIRSGVVPAPLATSRSRNSIGERRNARISATLTFSDLADRVDRPNRSGTYTAPFLGIDSIVLIDCAARRRIRGPAEKTWTRRGSADIVRTMRQEEIWDAKTAQQYDTPGSGMFAPEVLEPTVDYLAKLAGNGRALEFAIGTGRVAVPLANRGVPVTGIELSRPMVEKLRTKADEAAIPVVIGDMATARAPGEYTLVYLIYNTISNLLSQAEQVDCFHNAARHLSPGGRFVIELWVPELRKLPPGQSAA